MQLIYVLERAVNAMMMAATTDINVIATQKSWKEKMVSLIRKRILARDGSDWL
jgi:hypothetical protein